MPRRSAPRPVSVDPVDLLYVVTCRAEPNDSDQHNHVPMAAGHYQQFLVQATPPPDPLPMAKERGSDDGSLSKGQGQACACHTCADSPRFRQLRRIEGLPAGDVIIVVHGFNCTEETGLETANHLRRLLNAWGLPTAPATEMAATDQPHLLAFTWPCEHSLPRLHGG